MNPEEIDEIEAFFKSVPLPERISLNNAEVITDVPKFIESHLLVARTYGDIPAFSSFVERLRKLKGMVG